MAKIDESQLAKWKAYFDPKMFPGNLNIDRSKCKRTVPMQVLNLGMSRTGTACGWQALIVTKTFSDAISSNESSIPHFGLQRCFS
jgi:hypothetical protein